MTSKVSHFKMLSGILGVPTTPLYRRNSPALSVSSLHSNLKFNRISMATSASNAVLGDVYVDDLVSSCGGVLNLSKPACAYFKERARNGCLRARVNPTRQQLFGCSSFDGNSSLLHGPRVKNVSSSLSALCLARAVHDVSIDGSPPDEQLANSSILPNMYVTVIL